MTFLASIVFAIPATKTILQDNFSVFQCDVISYWPSFI